MMAEMATGLLEAAALGVMVFWTGVSAVCQAPCRLTSRLRRMDLAGLIPNWPFFAPVPGTCDYYLLYRDVRADGEVTDWRELSLCDDRRPWHVIWNPRKREKKALFDLTVALLREAQPDRLEAVRFSVPYLALITYVSSLSRQYEAYATQFLVMISDEPSRLRDPEPLFTSEVHLL